jgi:hypothetical protein
MDKRCSTDIDSGLLHGIRRQGRVQDERRVENGCVGANGQIDLQLAGVGGVDIVKRKPFANLAGGEADNRVCAGIVIGWPVEDFNANDALFELIGVPEERLLDDVG